MSQSRNIPDRHVGSRHDRELDGAGETLVTLRVIVLQADLELDGLEEVSLLCLQRVFEKFLDVGTHSGCGVFRQYLFDLGRREIRSHTDCNFRHDDSLPVESVTF